MAEISSDANRPVYALGAEEAAARLEVDPARGLSAAEAAERLRRDGPNQLEEGAKEPRWKAFLRQYQDFMQIILLAAAVGSVIVDDLSSAIILVLLTVANAVMGLRQESKAEESIAALRKLMKESARASLSYVRSQWAELNLEKQALSCGVHIHVPAGAGKRLFERLASASVARLDRDRREPVHVQR